MGEKRCAPGLRRRCRRSLLGDGQRLKPEHFKTENNNQELQLAAVRSVVHCKGQFGLEMALEYEQATHWWEEEFVAAQLSHMLIAENAPGSQELSNCKTLEPLRQWFAKYGEQYLERFAM